MSTGTVSLLLVFSPTETMCVRCKNQKKKPRKNKIILETHHPEIITDHIFLYMLALLYFIYTHTFKTKIGSHCILSCILLFAFQKVSNFFPHRYHPKKLFLMATYNLLFLKLPGALEFLPSFPLFRPHTLHSEHNTTNRQQQ